MLRSLNSGVSGLRSFQTKLDVIGNNIANVNTVGFKKGRVVFEDIFSQTIKGATGPTASSGGTNPIQVGLGSRVGSIDTVFTPGSPTTTNIGTDLYIDGDGFFVVQNGTEKLLTRAGNFTLDKNNQLVNQNGMKVLDQRGNPITIPSEFESMSIDANGVITGTDKFGNLLVGVDPATGAAVTQTQVNNGQLFNKIQIGLVAVNNPAGLQKVGGSLYSITPNADPLSIDDMFALPSRNTSAQIIAGTLEMSNVDLSEEMTEMITAQRGFQANAKIITVSDSVLEELVNLKR